MRSKYRFWRPLTGGQISPRHGCAAKPHGRVNGVPATGPTPASLSSPAFDVAVEVAGQRPALPQVQGATLQRNPTLRQRRLCIRPRTLRSCGSRAQARARIPAERPVRRICQPEVSMVIKPRVRGFICVTTHPTGCEAAVKQQIDYIRARPPIQNGPKRVLVIGASTGYGRPHASPPRSAVARQRWASSSNARAVNPSRVPPAGTTRPRSTSTPTKPACMPRASTAMPSPMR